MKYVSTRNTAEKITASQAIIRGLAPDGGLYVPEEIPQIDAGFIAALKKMDYRGRALAVLRLYLEEFSDEELTEIIRENDITSVTIVRMEVPCCGGLELAAKKALQASGKFIPWQVVTISLDGRIID